MKQITTLLFLLLVASSVFGQVPGNVNYQNRISYSSTNIDIGFPRNSDVLINVKGLANVKADSYVAIFNLTQVGKTKKEVNSLIDERINRAFENIKSNPKVETYVDMISFVPVYEYEVEKKIFSKKNYNEVPAGFELKKNIHIKYSNPNLLNEIVSDLSKAEIYDLIRVDYFSNNLESVKKQLSDKAKILLQGKLKSYETILPANISSSEKQLTDGYKVLLPVEMYRSYQAYSSPSLNLRKPANISKTEKSTTLYYQPIIDKEFDFVINPVILEPVIQVLYEIKLKVNKKKDKIQKADKEYILITPNGDIKELSMK